MTATAGAVSVVAAHVLGDSQRYQVARATSDTYIAITRFEEKPVANDNPVPFGTFQWIVTGLLAVICALIGFAWNSMDRRVESLDQTAKEISNKLTEARLSSAGETSLLREQAAATNAKLDAIIDQLRRNPIR